MSRKVKKKPKKIYKVLSFLLILISIIFVASLIYFNSLPILYLGIIIAIIGIIDLFLVMLMLHSRKKKTGALFSIVFSIIMAIISFFVFKTAGLLGNLNLNYKTYNYSVVVLKDSKYKKINDIKGKNLGFYETDGKECDKSISRLAKKVDTDNSDYDDVSTLAQDLFDKKMDAILVEDTYLDILNENGVTTSNDSSNDTHSSSSSDSSTDTKSFSDKTKVIYKFSIVVKTSDISKDLDVTKKPFNIYISGIDTYGSISSVSRSDVNMVVTVNPKTKQILLTSIPRDYYVHLHGKSGYNDKLTHAGLYGVDMSIKTIEDLMDIEINYYVKVNFTSVINIVDAIGGVDVYSDYDFTSLDGYKYSKGYNSVDGKEALSFARERKSFQAGDRQRVKDQQALLEAMFRKCTSTSIITKYNSLLDSVSGSFVTNMPTDRLKALIRMQVAKKYKWTITANSLDGANSSNYTYSYSSQKLYVMEPIEDSVNYAHKLIKSVEEGEKLDPTFDGNASDVHKVAQSSAAKSSSSSSSSTSSSSNYSEKNNEGLKVSIPRTTETITEGESYVYYPYTATYNGKDVSDSSSISFTVNGKVFTSYYNLISYIRDLSAGEYNIVHKVSYGGETKSLNQTLIVKAGAKKNNSSTNNSEQGNDNQNTTSTTTSGGNNGDSVDENDIDDEALTP